MKTLMSPYSAGWLPLDGALCHQRSMGWQACWHALYLPRASLASGPTP